MKRLLAFAISITAVGCATPSTAMVECPATGCPSLDAPTPMQRLLLAHAERDLSCPSAQLEIHDVDDTTSDVRGCGRTARYAWIVQPYGQSRWLLDSPVTSVGP
jgi:hypothetical protein